MATLRLSVCVKMTPMSIPELALELRTRGRPASPLTAVVVRELADADLALLASGRGVSAKPLVRLRDRHHAIARMVAQGRETGEISAITGMCLSRISILKNDPTFAELVSHYKQMGDAAQGEFVDRATTLALTAMDNLQTMLEDEENPLSANQTAEILKLAADRVGHAPVTKVQNTNINVDLGTKLAQARGRLERARIVASLPDDEQ